MNNRYGIALLAALLLTACGQRTGDPAAQVKITQINAQTGEIVIGDAWARPTVLAAAADDKSMPGMNMPDMAMPGMNSAVYLTIENRGGSADRLVSISGDVAESIELHVTTMKDGIMSMNPVPDGAEVPAGGSLVLKPASYHIMLMGVKQNLAPGGTFKLTLGFKSGAQATIDVPVRAP